MLTFNNCSLMLMCIYHCIKLSVQFVRVVLWLYQNCSMCNFSARAGCHVVVCRLLWENVWFNGVHSAFNFLGVHYICKKFLWSFMHLFLSVICKNTMK